MDVESYYSDFMAPSTCFCKLYLAKCLLSAIKPKVAFYVRCAEVQISARIAGIAGLDMKYLYGDLYETKISTLKSLNR